MHGGNPLPLVEIRLGIVVRARARVEPRSVRAHDPAVGVPLIASRARFNFRMAIRETPERDDLSQKHHHRPESNSLLPRPISQLPYATRRPTPITRGNRRTEPSSSTSNPSKKIFRTACSENR